VADISEEVAQRIGNKPDAEASTAYEVEDSNSPHRYGSFAPQRLHNDVKWYVDGCGYFYAVSLALERAKESIWILDCKHFITLWSFNFSSLNIFFRVAFTRAVSQTTSREKSTISPRPNTPGCC
jgi:hypothetical protein